VLIVDDNVFNLTSLSMMLELKFKVKSMTAPNGEIAFNKVKEKNKQILLILMDIEMPVMNGFQSSRAIISYCEENSLRLPYIVALTANEQNKSIKDKCQEAGMQDILAKPIRSNEITALLHKLKMIN